MLVSLLISLVSLVSVNSDSSVKDKGRIEKDSLLKVYEQIQNKPNKNKLVDEINNIAYKIYPSDYLKSFEIARKALILSQKSNYQKGKAEALHILGISFNYSENYVIANQYQDQSIKIAGVIDDKELLARAYNAKGLAQYRLNNFERSQQFYNSALYNIRKIKVKHQFEGAILHNIASLLDKEGKSEQAILMYNEAIEINKSNKNKLWLGQNYYEKAIALKNLLKYNEAVELSKMAFQISKEIDDVRLMVNNLNFIANIHINFDEFKKAEELLNTAAKLSVANKLTKTRLQIIKSQSRLAEKQQKFKQAFEFQKSYNLLYDSVYNADRFKQLDEFRSYFEAEQKQKENTYLLKSNLSQEIKIQNKNYFIFLIFLLLSLSIYLTYLIYKNGRKIVRSNQGLVKQYEEINLQKQKLEELNQLKNKFFSIISHDLRSPLLSLKGMFIFFENSEFDESELRIFMRELENNFKNTSNLVDNLLIWAKSQMQGESLEKKRIDICKITDENISLLKIQHKCKNLKFSNHLESCFAYADEETMNVVIRNLLNNACKFTPDGGEITIRSKKDELKLIVCIKDTGVGMTEEQIKQVANHQFYTTRGTKSEKGTGLGLMLCDEFIKKNNGEFCIESEKGKGSSFYFSLPLSN